MLEYTNPNDYKIIDALDNLYEKLQKKEFVNGTVELLDFHGKFDPAYQYFDFFGVRPARRKYIEHEYDWYMSLDKSIKGHAGIENNKIWQAVASKDEKQEINSQYGYLVFSPENGVNGKSQFELAKEQLLKDQHTRQAVIHYSRPTIWKDYCENGKHDYICTFNTTFEIRDSKLNMLVYMRSNAVFTGFVNDFAWQYFVYHKMKDELKESGLDLKDGDIYWNAASFHAYEADFEDLTKIVLAYREDNHIEIEKPYEEV